MPCRVRSIYEAKWVYAKTSKQKIPIPVNFETQSPKKRTETCGTTLHPKIIITGMTRLETSPFPIPKPALLVPVRSMLQIRSHPKKTNKHQEPQEPQDLQGAYSTDTLRLPSLLSPSEWNQSREGRCPARTPSKPEPE